MNRATPGCGRSIAREDLVNIASLKNHTKKPLHYSTLCFPTDRGVVCSRHFSIRKVWEIACAGIVYKLQVTTTSQEASAPLYFPTYRSVFHQMKICARAGCGISLAQILYILQVTTTTLTRRFTYLFSNR